MIQAQKASRVELQKAVEVMRELRKRERYNKLDFYDPYPYQQGFHETGLEAMGWRSIKRNNKRYSTSRIIGFP